MNSGKLMTLDDIKQLIKNDESRSVEYKQSISELEKLGRAICGFLNGEGGVGLIGISDKKKIMGIEVTESTKNKLSSFCNHFDPWPDIEINYISAQESTKQLVCIKAKPRKDKIPFSYKGIPYLRNEAQLKKMPVESYKQRLLNSAGFSELWESLPAKNGYTIEDLDTTEILKTINIAVDNKRVPSSIQTKDIKEALTSLDMIDNNNEINNAAMVLFAKKMPADYPQCFIRLGCFIDETMNDILDSKQVRGNAFEILDEAESFIRKHLSISSHFSPNQMERIDEPAIPFLAVREAIINALVHRDYSDRTGDIALLIFNTHLEIHNAGHLYGDMTIPQLKVRHTSRRRNPRIANVFHARKLIERYGSGTLRMIELCKEQNLEPPLFSEVDDGFLVQFYFKQSIGQLKQIIQQGEHGPMKFSERERTLLVILNTQKQMTLKEIISRITNPPTDRTIRNTLTSLREKGMVSSKGTGRGSYWFLTSKITSVR